MQRSKSKRLYKRVRRKLKSRQRQKIPKNKRINSTLGSPSFTKCNFGRRVKFKNSERSLLTYNDFLDKEIFSTGQNSQVTVAAESGITLGYMQSSGTGVVATETTATSGSNAIFVWETANVSAVTGATVPWSSKFTAVGSSTDANPQAQKFRIESTHMEVNITNTSNVYAEATLYDYVYRQDISGNPIKLWADGLAAETPVSATQTMFPHKVKSNPFMSTIYTNYIKVVKTSKIWMAPGATHTHSHTHYVNKDFTTLRFTYGLNQTSGNVAWLTSGVMLVACGQPVEATSGAAGQITTGIVSMDSICKYSAKLSRGFSNQTTYNAESTGSTGLYEATQAVGLFKAFVDSAITYIAATQN